MEDQTAIVKGIQEELRSKAEGSKGECNAPWIIAELAREKTVETIVDNIAKGTFPYTEDLIQDIYMELLSKPEEKIIQLYNRKQLNYFITTIVKNNLFSVNSRYYYNYMRWEKNRTEYINKEDKDIYD